MLPPPTELAAVDEARFVGDLLHNPQADHRDLFGAKTASYRQRWPWLQLQHASGP